MAWGTKRGKLTPHPPVLLTDEEGHELAEELVRLTVENNRLRATLAVYADEDNWEDCIWNGELGGPDVARRELAGKEARDG